MGALPEARGVSPSAKRFHFVAEVVKVTSWLPPHAVSDAILDVAFADEEPPIAVNVVHPRPIAWVSLMQPMSEAVYRKDLTSSPLPLIGFSQWVARLNERAVAESMSEANIRRLVCVSIRRCYDR